MKNGNVLRSCLILLCGCALLSSCLCASAAGQTFTSKGASDLTNRWLGFGYNEYPVDRNNTDTDIAWTTSSLNLTEARIAYLHPGLTRINWYRAWFNPSGVVGTYDWTTLEATATFQILDFYKAQNLPLQIGIWHDEISGDDASFYTSQSFAVLQADLINELVNVKGYTNIVFYAATNEPDGEGFNQSEWQTMISNLYTELGSRGLPKSLIIGPDTAYSTWTLGSTSPNALSATEYHKYVGTGVTNYIQTVSATRTKQFGLPNPIYLSEMGIGDPDSNSQITTFGYGLDMIDYGVQAARAGESGALAWCLDGFDYSKNCGMWDISGQFDTSGNASLRPWFYSWSLLTKFFPAGWTPAIMPETSTLAVLGAHGPVGAGADWSFALVNRGGSSVPVTLEVPGWGTGTFSEYLYSSSSMPTDANGFPVPYATVTTASGGLASGVTVSVPANSAVVLTTIGQTSISSMGAIATSSVLDHLTDWSQSNSHTANWVFDSSSPSYFNNDVGRIKRTSNTAENVIYRISTGVTGYYARAYFYDGNSTSPISISTSPDGSTWTSNAFAANPPVVVQNGGGWAYVDLANAATIPTGTQYLKVQVAQDAVIYAPQLTEIDVNGPVILSSGLEAGQTPVTWTNTVDTGPEAGAGNISNVSGAILQVTTAAAHTGTHSLQYGGSGTSSSSDDAAYLKAFDLTGSAPIIGAGTTLSYWIYPQSSTTNPSVSGNNSTCVAIDMDFSDGTALRNYNYGPSAYCGTLQLDTWNHVFINLGNVAVGETIDKIVVGYEQSKVTGGYAGFIDDIVIQ